MTPELKKKMSEQAESKYPNENDSGYSAFVDGATWMFEEMEKINQGAREWELGCRSDYIWWECRKTPDNENSKLGEIVKVREVKGD